MERFAVGFGVHPLKPGRYQFHFTRYQHRFKRAIQTCYGVWQVREGVALQLIDETGQNYWGEIAPLPWFGSETLEQALEFCDQLPAELTEATIFSIPNKLPACQFGFESALGLLKADGPPAGLVYSRLLPAGKVALQSWQTFWERGYCTFKWKIGVFPIAEELEIFHQLIQVLPSTVKLRLDANGGLVYEAANQWLRACDEINQAQHLFAEVEYIEQPLPPQQFEQMQELSYRYAAVPIALDESVATLEDLQTCYERGWRGVFVIKPAIVGSPTQLRQFCQTHPIDAVFSTAFETPIGRRSGLQLAAELSNLNRAVGYDGNWHEFDYLEFPLKEDNSPL